MSHANAALTPRARLRLAQLIVESGWTYAAAAKMFMVAPRTAKKWADRFRADYIDRAAYHGARDRNELCFQRHGATLNHRGRDPDLRQ